MRTHARLGFERQNQHSSAKHKKELSIQSYNHRVSTTHDQSPSAALPAYPLPLSPPSDSAYSQQQDNP